MLLAYENEAITAQQMDVELDYVIPPRTVLIENPVAVTTRAKPQARAFVDFLWSRTGQRAFARHGYRPVDDAVFRQFADRFPIPEALFTIGDLGGWRKINDTFFHPDRGSVAKIEREAGVSTAR